MSAPGERAELAREGERPLAMSISGAISVGSYQAGVNWGLLEVFRRASIEPSFRARYGVPRFKLSALTGASAGNINTLLWAVEWCSRAREPGALYHTPNPDESLFAQVWTRIDVTDMLRPPSAGPPEYALLNLARVRQRTDIPVLRRLGDPRLEESCEVPIGITLTRIKPGTLRLKDQLAVETQRFATLFRARVNGRDPLNGQRMRFYPMFEDEASYRDPRFGKLVRLAPFPGEIITTTILEAVQASSAYPLAFRPVELGVQHPDSTSVASQLFVDGGVFDNNPLSLALNVYRVRHDAKLADDTLAVVYVNPGQLRGPIASEAGTGAGTIPPGGLGAVFSMVGGAVNTARQYELQLVAREQESADSVRHVLQVLAAERGELAERSRELAEQLLSAFGQLRLRQREGRLLRARIDSLIQRVDSAAVRDSARFDLLQQGDSVMVRTALDSLKAIRLPSMPPPFQLHMTTRAFPIFSDRLNSFAGFLGRPLREFDFWVGTYDALHLVAVEFHCTSTRLTGGAQNDCVRGTMEELIQDTVFFREPGRSVLAALYDTEFRGGTRALRDVIERDPFSVRELRTDSIAAQRAVLLALFRSIEGDARRHDPVPCQSHTPLGALLCRSGLTPALLAFAADTNRVSLGEERLTPMDIVTRWSKAPACHADAADAVDCRAQPLFVELVRDPEHGVATLTDQLIRRLDDTEDALKARSAAQSGLYGGLSQTAQWMYHFGNLAHTPRSQWFTSTIPDEDRTWLRYLPHHIGGMIGGGGVELRYRPTHYLSDRTAITVPVLGYWLPESAGPSGKDLFVGSGVGVARRLSFPTALLASEFGVETHVNLGMDVNNGATSKSAEVEPYAIILAGALRLGWRLDLYDYKGRGHIPSNLTIGITDPGSLLHWITR